MAWNRPVKNVPKYDKRKVGAGNHIVHGLLAVLVFIALSTTALLFLRPQHTERVGSWKHDIVKKRDNSVKSSSDVQSAAKPARPRLMAGENTPQHASPTGIVCLTKNVTPPAVLSNNFYNAISGGRPLFRRPIFKHHSENTLGGLLAATPGQRFLPVEFDEEFDEDFAKSLGEEIAITVDDSEEDIVLKQAVMKIKQQIIEAVKKGLKPSEVVTDMRDEMNRVADYRDLLQEEFDKMKESSSAEKIEAYLEEANRLLDEFGAEHLDLPNDEIEMINERLEKDPEGETYQEESNEQVNNSVYMYSRDLADVRRR